MTSYLESSARMRVNALLDANTFTEFLPPSKRVTSPHLAVLNTPVSFDDGVVIGEGKLRGKSVMIASQEGAFMGGAVGEVHGAKLVGLLKRAAQDRAYAVLLLLETGGVRLHEANAGLIAVSEVMRALLDSRAAGIPVVVLIGGSNGCFGGMGIVARCANAIVMSEEGRLAMSGPEVIETANGVEEFDSRDRALVWRTTGGKHRYLQGDCDKVVSDDINAFRNAAVDAIETCYKVQISLTLSALLDEQQMLEQRISQFGTETEPLNIWARLGVPDPAAVSMMEAESFMQMATTATRPTRSAS